MLSQFRVIAADPALKLRNQFTFFHPFYLVGRERYAKMDMNGGKPWKTPGTGPSVERPFHRNRQNRRAAADRQGGKPRHKRSNFAIGRPGPFGEDQDHFPVLKPAKGFFDPPQGVPFDIERNRIVRTNQPGKEGESEKAAPGQRVHHSGETCADQGRIEEALVVGDQEDGPLFGDVIYSRITNTKRKHQAQTDPELGKRVPHSVR